MPGLVFVFVLIAAVLAVIVVALAPTFARWGASAMKYFSNQFKKADEEFKKEKK